MTIEDILIKLNNYSDNTKIRISDGTYLISEYGSDRGDYSDMYIGYTRNKDSKNILNTVGELKKLINQALSFGRMTGYKGGEFDIDNSTFVRIGAYGFSGSYISDIRQIDDVIYVVYEEVITREVWNI